MTAAMRVLLVEDSATDAKLVVQVLRQTWPSVDFERVETADTMRAALARGVWDVVLSDWSMPRFSAGAALSVLRESGVDLPFIIVSGTIGEDTAADAMRSGAHDYVLKDRLGRLNPAIERELRECAERKAHRHAADALRESERRFGRLAESGLIGIFVAEISGRILEANDTFLKMVGYSRQDLLGGSLSWADMTPPEWAHTNLAATERLRAVGVMPHSEKEYFRKDGSRVPVLVGVAALDDTKNISMAIDLTDLKRAEAGRERAEEALHVSEEQLRQAQKMEAVGRLAGGVAHDFNNVLTVILSCGETLLAGLSSADPARGDIEEIRTAALRAAGLTRQLLMFSRQQPLEQRVLDLNEVLASMDGMLHRILGEDVALVTLCEKAVGRVKADPSHIEQVILNLVVNARDAMPTGGKLTIETANVVLDEGYAQSHLPARAGSYVMLAVTDSGAGIDKATQARIFEPFFTTKEKGKGTGLGLSTVFGIVQQSGGNIWVYSEEGRGTTFKIYLPSVDGEPDSVREQPAPSTLRGWETVLLVEDEEQVRAVLLNVLRKQGYRAIAAQNAEEALLICEKEPGTIDLLLTDVVMPQMSGPELAKRLATARPQMKVLCMSGYTDDSVVRHGVLESGVAFLQKPITPAALARKVREILDGDPSATATRA